LKQAREKQRDQLGKKKRKMKFRDLLGKQKSKKRFRKVKGFGPGPLAIVQGKKAHGGTRGGYQPILKGTPREENSSNNKGRVFK